MYRSEVEESPLLNKALARISQQQKSMQNLALVIIPVALGLVGCVVGSILRCMCKITPCPITEHDAKSESETVVEGDDEAVEGDDVV